MNTHIHLPESGTVNENRKIPVKIVKPKIPRDVNTADPYLLGQGRDCLYGDKCTTCLGHRFLFAEANSIESRPLLTEIGQRGCSVAISDYGAVSDGSGYRLKSLVHITGRRTSGYNFACCCRSQHQQAHHWLFTPTSVCLPMHTLTK